jgi:hypothetical protein
MLHAGLDLSRNRLDYCLLTEDGERIEVGAAPPDGDGLAGLAQRVARDHGPVEVRAAIESMNGARFVHDTLEVNAYFAFNWEGKQESTLNEEPTLSKLPFVQAAQVLIPAHEPPNATVPYQLNSRGGGGLRTLNVPNWEGTTNQVQIFWNDFEGLKF